MRKFVLYIVLFALVIGGCGGKETGRVAVPPVDIQSPPTPPITSDSGALLPTPASAGGDALPTPTLAVVIGGINAGYAVLGARARHFFANARAQRHLHRVAGTLMLLAALLVATR